MWITNVAFGFAPGGAPPSARTAVCRRSGCQDGCCEQKGRGRHRLAGSLLATTPYRGPGLVGGEGAHGTTGGNRTRPLLEKQGLEVVMAAISELKPDACGQLQGWQMHLLRRFGLDFN